MTSPDSPILIAYDGSEPARQAIAHAGRLFRGQSAVVATVWSSVREAARAARAALPQAVIDDAVQNIDKAAEEQAAETAAEGVELATEAGLKASVLTLEGIPSVPSSLVRHADELQAGVVVVGSRGQSAIKSALLGSVSHAVVHHAGRPVLVVHPTDAPPAGG
jgi:nucleotide-binding universal stress UspA family protein